MGDAKTIGANARIAGLSVFPSLDGTRRIELGRLEMDDVEGDLGGASYRARELVIDGLQTLLGRVQTNAESAVLTDASVQTSDRNLRLRIGQLGFPRGFALTHDTELFAPHASLEDARFTIDDAVALFAGAPDEPSGKASDHPSEHPGDAQTRRTAEHRFLDALHGQLDIDLVVDFTLPWIGRRRATHYLRIPIRDGTIDFEELENDVHWLENLFLDLEVMDDKLVLERDLPLVPFASKALMWWNLEPEDVPLAHYRRVHLRNLLRWEFPPRDDAAKPRGKSKYGLHEIALENCSLALETITPAKLELGGSLVQFGGEEQTGLTGAVITGALRHGRDQAPPPTSLSGRIAQMDATVVDLPLGAVTLSADRLHIGEVENLELQFDGFRPGRLSGTISRIAATNLRIQF